MKRHSAGRMLAATLVLIGGWAVGSTQSASAAAKPARTVTVVVQPVTQAGILRKPFKVVGPIEDGTCGPSVLGSATWSCTTNQGGYELCWEIASPHGGLGVCLKNAMAPWSHALTEVTMNETGGPPLQGSEFPLAVQITGGDRCTLNTGGGLPISGNHYIAFVCSRHNLVLVDWPANKKHPLWSEHTGHLVQEKLVLSKSSVAIAKVWYAGASPGWKFSKG